MIDFVAYVSSLVLGVYFSIFSPEHTKATDCGTHSQVSYCYYQGDPESSRIVYFLHGFGNDSSAWSWNSVTGRIESEWKKNLIKRPHVVAISFGRLWWYKSEKQKMDLKLFLEWIERDKKLAGLDRVLYGDSMGGNNSYRWAHDEPNLFKKLALICPAVPFSFVKDLKTPGGAWPFYFFANSLIAKTYAEANPLLDPRFWKRFNTISEIHIAVSPVDHFGFYDGGKALMDLFRTNTSSQITLEEQNVRHCDVGAEKLAKFLGQ